LPSGPIAAPFGPPPVSTTVSFLPSGVTRVSRWPLISVRMIEPSDRRAVRAAAQVRDHVHAAVGSDPGERLAPDLHQHHGTVVHRNRSFRKLQPLGHRLEFHACPLR